MPDIWIQYPLSTVGNIKEQTYELLLISVVVDSLASNIGIDLGPRSSYVVKADVIIELTERIHASTNDVTGSYR